MGWGGEGGGEGWGKIKNTVPSYPQNDVKQSMHGK